MSHLEKISSGSIAIQDAINEVEYLSYLHKMTFCVLDGDCSWKIPQDKKQDIALYFMSVVSEEFKRILEELREESQEIAENAMHLRNIEKLRSNDPTWPADR